MESLPQLSNPKTRSIVEVADKDKTAGSKTTLTPKPAGSSQDLDTVGSGEHLTDLAAIKRFGELQQYWFEDHMKLVSDGQVLELSKVSVEPAARHPYSVLVKFQFSLEKTNATEGSSVAGEPSVDPKADPRSDRRVDFQMTDEVFSGYAGATRYALRARGSTILLKSNVSPVLVRAERVEITPTAAMNATSSPTIQAKLTIGNQ